MDFFDYHKNATDAAKRCAELDGHIQGLKNSLRESDYERSAAEADAMFRIANAEGPDGKKAYSNAEMRKAALDKEMAEAEFTVNRADVETSMAALNAERGLVEKIYKIELEVMRYLTATANKEEE